MAKANESVSKEVLTVLGEYLNSKVPFGQVLYDFPEANDVLKFPSLCITTKSVDHQNKMPQVYSQGATSATAPKKAKLKYSVGEYVFKLKLDLWERSKEQRNDLYEMFYAGFNSRLPHAGLFLNLKNYHNVNSNYLITGYRFEDADIASQRKEWRAIVDVEVNCEAVLAKDEFIITDTELTLEIPATIEPPET